MIGTLAHRGPDGNGMFVDGDVGLAHARLSIIDLAGGQQPMANEDGTVWITFNGEIFNYVELRDELIAARPRASDRRPTPRSSSTSTRSTGRTASSALNGDSPSRSGTHAAQRLVLARDRMGVRPLYLRRARRRLVFASEMKALLQVPGIERRARPDRARPDLHVLVPAGAAHAVQGHLRAAAGARAGRRRAARHHDAAVLAPRLSRRRRRSPACDRPSEARHRRGAARAAARRDAHPAALRRAGRRLSQRRARFLDHHRRHPQRSCRDQLRTFSVALRDRRVRRERLPARDGRARSAPSTRRSLCRDGRHRRACFRGVIRHTERPILRTAPAPLLLLSRAGARAAASRSC